MQNQLHAQLKNLLAQNTGEVLQKLLEIFERNPEAYDEVILLLARYETFRKKIGKSLMSASEEELQASKITHSVLELINQISEEEANAYEASNAIFKRILVVCQTAAREAEMRRLFPDQYFKGVEFDVSKSKRPLASVNRFDLVIFDNNLSDDTGHAKELLRYYLDEAEPYVLYYGLYEPLLKDYPDKVYFANSVFSIHARLQEMLSYLKYRLE